MPRWTLTFSNFSFSYCNVFFSFFKSNKLREPGGNCGTCANATLQCMWLRVKWENKSFSDANFRNWCNGTPRPQTQWKHSKRDSTARHPNIQYLKMLLMGILGFFGFGNFVDMMSYRRGWKWISQGWFSLMPPLWPVLFRCALLSAKWSNVL